MKIKPVLILYIVSTLAFVFALLKYIVLDIYIPVQFLIFEVISFSGFLGIIYLSDSIFRKSRKLIEAKEQDFRYKEEKYIESIDHYKVALDKLKNENTNDITDDEITIIQNELIHLSKKSTGILKFSTELLIKLAKHYEIGVGVCYFKTKPSGKFSVQGVYGLNKEEVQSEISEQSGVSGECISGQKALVFNEIDQEYFNIESCSGASKPKHLYLLPIVSNNETIGIIELATFKLINIDNHWDKLSRGLSEIKVL